MLSITTTPLQATWNVFSEGHLDLRFLYDEPSGSGLRIQFYDLNSEALIDPASVTLRVKGEATHARPSAAAWNATGAAAGDDIWVLPQSQNVNLVWLGTRAAIADDAFRPLPPAPVFGTGQLALQLLAAEGSGVDAGGHFSLYSTDAFGFPTFAWSTADGIDDADVIAPINTRSHTHYNWAFTQPGDYLLQMEVLGYTRSDGTEKRTRAEIHFQVLPTTIVAATDLRLNVAGSNSTLQWQRPGGESPVVIWNSPDLERWWIEAVVPAPVIHLESFPIGDTKASFWRASDPLSTP